jgi:protease-4
MGNLAASGGYYISAPCRWIVANELTITGSIGVIMHGYNYRGLMDKHGIRPEVFKSGKYKDMLSSTKEPDEITQEEKDMVQKLINETYEKFKGVVADGRKAANQKNGSDGKKLTADWADYADGRIISGNEALQRGFVDELGDFDVAVDRAKTIAKIQSADLIQYQPVISFSSLFGRFFQSEAKKVLTPAAPLSLSLCRVRSRRSASS